ncbi:hypothetical protein GGR28_003404 [Lewinella aquimaris]|uniref:Uncharacterized protein n=1 Tax=Neolewinella aquimaris TaxID=1835722 RepID=A0A840EG30_9BACT|nr:hypothetical protein [Neolewinella aquimaris]MBB4080769.1 hypothetical protein [Neolewinella aquimaris]
MAMIDCAAHGNQSVVFVFSEDAKHFLTRTNFEDAEDWTVYVILLDELIEWHVLMKTDTFHLSASSLGTLGEEIIDRSMPVCKACVESVFGNLWTNLSIKQYKSSS